MEEHIRILEVNDGEKKSAYTREVLYKLPQWFGNKQSLEEYAEEVKEYPFYSAVDDTGKCVGFFSVKIHYQHTGDIFVCGVLPEYQHTGIGKALYRTSEEYFIKSGCKYVIVKTLSDIVDSEPYERTRRFYRSIGFDTLLTLTEMWDEKNPCLIMFKDIRLSKMNCRKEQLLLYAVTDRSWLKGETLYEQIEKALKGGVTFLQLREKTLSEEEFLKEAAEVKKLCQLYHVPFIINDNVEIALKSGADGVHIGQGDMGVKEARKILGELGMDINPRQTVGELTVAKQQMIEIAKALSVNAKILIMDEPTSALTSKEIQDLFGIIHKLKKDGCGIVYISHRLEELQHITDHVTIMRDGQYITEGDFSSMTMDEIIQNMVGREIKEKFPRVECKKGKKVFEVKNLNAGKLVRNIDFSLYEGEIVGVAGLMGAGRTETTRAIFGVDPKKSPGKFIWKGKKWKSTNPWMPKGRCAWQNSIYKITTWNRFLWRGSVNRWA